jgi:hypothetical protein
MEKGDDFIHSYKDIFLLFLPCSWIIQFLINFYLPWFFDPGEFRIYTNDGQELTEDDPIRVIGFVCEVFESNDMVYVYMCVMAIEAVK